MASSKRFTVVGVRDEVVCKLPVGATESGQAVVSRGGERCAQAFGLSAVEPVGYRYHDANGRQFVTVMPATVAEFPSENVELLYGVPSDAKSLADLRLDEHKAHTNHLIRSLGQRMEEGRQQEAEQRQAQMQELKAQLLQEVQQGKAQLKQELEQREAQVSGLTTQLQREVQQGKGLKAQVLDLKTQLKQEVEQREAQVLDLTTQLTSMAKAVWYPGLLRELCRSACKKIKGEPYLPPFSTHKPKSEVPAEAKEWFKKEGAAAKLQEEDLDVIFLTDEGSVRDAGNKAIHEVKKEDQKAAVQAVEDAKRRESLLRIYTYVHEL